MEVEIKLSNTAINQEPDLKIVVKEEKTNQKRSWAKQKCPKMTKSSSNTRILMQKILSTTIF